MAGFIATGKYGAGVGASPFQRPPSPKPPPPTPPAPAAAAPTPVAAAAAAPARDPVADFIAILKAQNDADAARRANEQKAQAPGLVPEPPTTGVEPTPAPSLPQEPQAPIVLGPAQAQATSEGWATPGLARESSGGAMGPQSRTFQQARPWMSRGGRLY
jgi:hypothetical protein